MQTSVLGKEQTGRTLKWGVGGVPSLDLLIGWHRELLLKSEFNKSRPRKVCLWSVLLMIEKENIIFKKMFKRISVRENHSHRF